MSEIEKLNMIAEWQEQYKQLIEDLNNSKKRIAEAEELIKKIISTYENPRTVIPFKCAIKHAKEFIKWKE